MRVSRRVCLIAFTQALTAVLGGVGGLAMASDSEARLRAMISTLPASLEGWRKAETCEVYTPEDLYRYINGGAELYISFRFQTLVSQPYFRGDGEVRLDVFDMGSSASAFGIFSHSRETVDRFVTPDVESEYAGGLLTFWKGRYYGSILAYPETESTKALVRELARGITAQIAEESRKPAIVSLVPQDDLVPYSIRFFWHHAWINDYRFFTHENLLNLDGRAEAVMARYRQVGSGQKPAVLLAIRYPDEEAAAAAQEDFSAALLPEAVDGLQKQDDGNWLGCGLAGDLVIVVADAPERETAARLIEACAERRETEAERREPGAEGRDHDPKGNPR